MLDNNLVSDDDIVEEAQVATDDVVSEETIDGPTNENDSEVVVDNTSNEDQSDVVNTSDDVSDDTEETVDEEVNVAQDSDDDESDQIVLDEEDILDEDDSESNELNDADAPADLKWYIVQCFALHEQKVRDRILQMQEEEFKGIIYRVLLPEEETVEIKNNERKEKIKKMFPGYLFVQMKPDEGVWYTLRRLPGVTKLVGTKNEPTPVSEDEINRILRQLGEKMKKIEVDFEINETIKVISGPFRGYTGAISEINADRGKLKSLISIFGRETPVELDFDQVEKYVGNK